MLKNLKIETKTSQSGSKMMFCFFAGRHQRTENNTIEIPKI